MTRRARGFTLVEMMVVVAIMSVVTVMAVRVYSRGARAERLPGTARDLVAHLHEARHAALSLGQVTRVRFNPQNPGVRPSFIVERLDAPNSTNWFPLGPRVQIPTGAQLCDLLGGAILTTAAPSCPFTATSAVCFQPTGRATMSADGNCPGATAGATLALQDEDGHNNPRRYKVLIWGLTGLPKLVDQW